MNDPSAETTNDCDSRDEILVFDDQLADGDLGGTGDANDPSALDTPDEAIDNAYYATQMQRIVELEFQCQTREAVWLKAQAATKKARAGFEAVQAQLRCYIRGLSKSMPLFDGTRHDSPADATVEPLSQEAESGDSGAGAGAGEPIGPSDANDDEGWKDIDLTGVLPSGIVKVLAAAKIHTIGQLAKQSALESFKDIMGIGPARRAKIDFCMDKFWTARLTSLVK